MIHQGTRTAHGARASLAVVALLAALAACGSPRGGRSAPDTEVPARSVDRADDTPPATPALAGARLTVRRTGGIAGLATEATVNGDAPSYTTVTSRPCASNAPCPSMDSASGPLPADSARALFAVADSVGVWALQEDYGSSEQARDQYFYEITVERGGRSKTVRADDITMPATLGELLQRFWRTIDGARGR